MPIDSEVYSRQADRWWDENSAGTYGKLACPAQPTASNVSTVGPGW